MEVSPTMTTPDPSAFFRDMLGQWEKMANSFGGDAVKSEEFTRAMHGASAAAMQAQAQTHEMMAKALAAANLPSRKDVEDLAARLAAVEATLHRIEAKLDGTPAAKPDRPKPKRDRKPPKPIA